MIRLIAVILIVGSILAGIFGPQFLFTVDETQMAIVTRFGNPQNSITKPGLYTKTPFVDKVTYFDKRRRLIDEPSDSFLTADKKRLVIDIYAIGLISNPLVFFQKVKTNEGAVTASVPIISSQVRAEIAGNLQVQIIQTSREQIMNSVTEAGKKRLAEFGIDLVDVRVGAIDFPPEIAPNIYERMRAERKRRADGERATGAQKDLNVRADVDRQATIIRAEAERDANIIRGEGEARAVKIFADALNQGPEFFAFQRSLDAYRKFLKDNTTAYFTSDSDLFKFLSTPGTATLAGGQSAKIAAGTPLAGVDAAARLYLSETLGVDKAAPILVSSTEIAWPNASLGCPKAGAVYAQVITPGWNLKYIAAAALRELHTNPTGSLVVSCKAPPVP